MDNENLQGQEVNKEFKEINNENLQSIDTNINNLLKFFENEKEEQKIQKQENIKQQEIDEKKELEEQTKTNEQLEKEKEKQDKFYENINTLVENTDSVSIQENQEILVSAIQDLSILTQVNIMCFGLLLGIVSISLLSKFFKK